MFDRGEFVCGMRKAEPVKLSGRSVVQCCTVSSVFI